MRGSQKTSLIKGLGRNLQKVREGTTQILVERIILAEETAHAKALRQDSAWCV